MHKDSDEEEIKQFYDDQFKIVEQYCKVYNISPQEMLDQVYEETIGEIDEGRRREFVNKILWHPIAFRILFITNTPTEDFQNRAKLYTLSPPLQDHRYLCLLAKHLRKSGWENYLNDLAHDFMVNSLIDLQKLNGRPGTIAELRENYERVTELEDGTKKWEIDAWPKARVIQFVRNDGKKIEAHFYLLQKQEKWEFDNFIDEFMIGWMQDFDLKEGRNDVYEVQQGNPYVLIYVYDLNERLLEKFPFTLKEKYKPLLKSLSQDYPLEKIRGEFDTREQEQVAENAFFESILNYTSEKGPPPGYFKLAILHDLFKEYKKRENERAKTISLDHPTDDQKNADEEEKGMPLFEILRTGFDVKSNLALIDEIIRDTTIEDEVDNIILKNYVKSDSQIATIVTEKLHKSMTKQAVRKRRINNIKPLLVATLERKLTFQEDQNRGKKFYISESIARKEEEKE